MSDQPGSADYGATGGPPRSTAGTSKRLQQTQAQVDEVVDIMKVNVDKVLERDAKLTQIDERAETLQSGAAQFETSAKKLKRKFWWQNLKMWLLLGGVGLVVVIIIVVWIVTSVGSDEPEPKTPTTTTLKLPTL